MRRNISGHREGKGKMAKPVPVLVSALSRVPSPKKNSNKKSNAEIKRLFKKKKLSRHGGIHLYPQL